MEKPNIPYKCQGSDAFDSVMSLKPPMYIKRYTTNLKGISDSYCKYSRR